MKFLVRFGAEMAIKSDRVRSRFQSRMIKNIKTGFKRSGVKASIETQWSRLFITVDDQQGALAKGILLNTFGVSSVSLIEAQCPSTLEDIEKTGLECYRDRVKDKAFRVTARRAGVKGFDSQDVQLALGGALYPFAREVNLKHPEINVNVEVRKEGSYFFSENLAGVAGLPIGEGGKVLCLISGGFDSVVAAQMMMRRGLDMEFLFCNLAGQAYERSVINVTRFLFEKFGHGSCGRMHILDYQPVVDAIKENAKPSYAQVVLKRMFYRSAEMLANELGCEAIVTGEAVAQVSSQTLRNLVTIESAIEMPVLRPLIGSEKSDIISYARKIGTFDLCAVIKEYCQLVPDKPVTAASKANALAEEERIDADLIERVHQSRKKLYLTDITNADLNSGYLFVDAIPEGAVVIDIRPSEEYQDWHYAGALNHEWGELLRSYNKLDKNSKYVLYCPVGLQSSVMAEKMQAAGYDCYSLRGGLRRLQSQA